MAIPATRVSVGTLVPVVIRASLVTAAYLACLATQGLTEHPLQSLVQYLLPHYFRATLARMAVPQVVATLPPTRDICGYGQVQPGLTVVISLDPLAPLATAVLVAPVDIQGGQEPRVTLDIQAYPVTQVFQDSVAIQVCQVTVVSVDGQVHQDSVASLAHQVIVE